MIDMTRLRQGENKASTDATGKLPGATGGSTGHKASITAGQSAQTSTLAHVAVSQAVTVDREAAQVLDPDAVPRGGLGEFPAGDPASKPDLPEPVTGTAPVVASPVYPATPRADSAAEEAGSTVASAEETDTTPPTQLNLKDDTMNNEVNEQMNEAANDMQQRSKEAYGNSSEMMGEMAESTQGSMQALAESGKIFSNGMQDLARNYVEDAKSAYEQMTTDLREMAAVKSPTELLQLQGKIMRRNFDTMVSATSKNTERMMKLSNDAFAPISERMSVAANKVAKAD